MNINEVSGNNLPIPSAGRKKEREQSSASAKSGDKVQVSDKARALFKKIELSRLEEIQQRIKDGFYFNKDVTERVVDRMMKDALKVDGN